MPTVRIGVLRFNHGVLEVCRLTGDPEVLQQRVRAARYEAGETRLAPPLRQALKLWVIVCVWGAATHNSVLHLRMQVDALHHLPRSPKVGQTLSRFRSFGCVPNLGSCWPTLAAKAAYRNWPAVGQLGADSAGRISADVGRFRRDVGRTRDQTCGPLFGPESTKFRPNSPDPRSRMINSAQAGPETSDVGGFDRNLADARSRPRWCFVASGAPLSGV